MNTSERFASSEDAYITLPRKASRVNYLFPVPRTNTRGQGEDPKVSEWTIAKELCKFIP